MTVQISPQFLAIQCIGPYIIPLSPLPLPSSHHGHITATIHQLKHQHPVAIPSPSHRHYQRSLSLSSSSSWLYSHSRIDELYIYLCPVFAARNGGRTFFAPKTPEAAVLAFVYRLHFSRACLGTLYALIVERRSQDQRASKQSSARPCKKAPGQPHSYSGSKASGCANVEHELHEENLLVATSLQLKNALLCKNIEEQGADFNIDFAKDLKPYLRGKLGNQCVILLQKPGLSHPDCTI